MNLQESDSLQGVAFGSVRYRADHSSASSDVRLTPGSTRDPKREERLLRKLEKRQRAGMARFAFFIYRFNSPIMDRLLRRPRNVWQMEQAVISMLAGDLFDSPNVVRRLKAFKFVYAMTALRYFARWRRGHRYRLKLAQLQFTGGTTPLDRQ